MGGPEQVRSESLLSSIACAGELRPDEGDAFVAGHSVIGQLSAARQQLGYCPQARRLSVRWHSIL